jgi:type IV pilus assembly protein PilA
MPNGMPAAPARKSGIPVWAMILIGVAISIPLLGIAAAIVIPGMLRSRIAGNEASAVGSMRAIISAQAVYAASCAGGLYARSLPVLGKGPADGSGGPFVSVDLALSERVQRNGYICWIDAPALFANDGPALASVAPPCNGVDVKALSQSYIARAEPVSPATGRRYFATNESGVVYHSLQPITFAPDGSANSPAAPLQ